MFVQHNLRRRKVLIITNVGGFTFDMKRNENTLILDFQNINGRTRTIFLTEEEKKELTKTIRETMRFEINE